MKQRLHEMPILLRALTAYTALAAVTLGLFSAAIGDGRHTLYALALLANAGLLMWRDQRTWYLQIAGAAGLLVASAMQAGSLVVVETLILIVLAAPSTRSWYGVRGPLAA